MSYISVQIRKGLQDILLILSYKKQSKWVHYDALRKKKTQLHIYINISISFWKYMPNYLYAHFGLFYARVYSEGTTIIVQVQLS